MEIHSNATTFADPRTGLINGYMHTEMTFKLSDEQGEKELFMEKASEVVQRYCTLWGPYIYIRMSERLYEELVGERADDIAIFTMFGFPVHLFKSDKKECTIGHEDGRRVTHF